MLQELLVRRFSPQETVQLCGWRHSGTHQPCVSGCCTCGGPQVALWLPGLVLLVHPGSGTSTTSTTTTNNNMNTVRPER